MDIPDINISGVKRTAASWQNKITKHANANALGGGKGILLTETSDGTSIRSTRQNTINNLYWSYTSEYNQTASYAINDVVRVMPGANYGVSASIGVWITVCAVPDKDLSDVIVSTYGSGSYPQWVRQPNAQYFPQWPESSSVATSDNPVGRYFECIGFLNTGSSGGWNWTGPYSSSVSYSYQNVTLKNYGLSMGMWLNISPSGSVGVDPAFPPPSIASGSGYADTWQLISFGVTTQVACAGGGSSTTYIQSNTP